MALAFDADPVADRGADGLADIRAKLQGEVERRWGNARREVMRAVAGQDALQLGPAAPVLAQPTAIKAEMFRRWLDERLMRHVIGTQAWLHTPLDEAMSRAVGRSRSLATLPSLAGGLPTRDAQQGFGFLTMGFQPPTGPVCKAAAANALAGVCDSVSAQAQAAVASGLLLRNSPMQIARLLDRAFATGLRRTRALAEHVVTMAHAQSTLDALEAMGVSHVGTISEQPGGSNAELDDEAVVDGPAGIMFTTPDGLALFLRRTDGQGWAFPGGGVDQPETEENGAQREAQEELGGFWARQGLTEVSRHPANGYVTFSAQVEAPFEPHLNSEHDDWTWAPVDAPPEPLHPGVRWTLGELEREALRDEEASGWAVWGNDVVPVGEVKAHVRGAGCWCHPHEDNGIVVHHLADFDPNEPRDEAGKWTTSAAGPGGPYLVPTILWKGKRYYPKTTGQWSHAGVAASNPDLRAELTRADWQDEDVIRYTTPEGKLLNRTEARQYAEQTGILDPHFAYNQPDLISEQLQEAATDPAHLLFRRQPGERGMTAVSPSVHEIDFATALSALKGDKQRSFAQASAEIDQGLGLEARDIGVVGAWKDGAENTLVTQVQHADWDRLTASAAMKAHLSNQKAALVFMQGGDGDAALYKFHAAGDVGTIHAGLLADGVAFHSLAPDEDGNGATVYVADLDGSAYHGVAKAAERFNAKVDYQLGRAAFLGSDGTEGNDAEQRAHARAAYEGIIRQSQVPASADVWRGVHSRWGQALADAWAWFEDAARKNPQPQHPRTGRFAKAHVVAREKRRSKLTGRFRAQGLSPEAQRKEELTEARFGRVKGKLDVLTRGDDRVCDVCDGISANGPYTISRARSLIPAHPNAVLEGSTFASYGPAHEMARARFSGPAVRLRTTVKTLTIGPNHPMLTKRGFVRAADLKEGDDLLYDLRTEGAVSLGEADLEDMPMVEDVFEASWPIGSRSGGPASGAQFHGDEASCYGEVEVVKAARLLSPIFDPCGIEQFSEFVLPLPSSSLDFIASLRAEGFDLDAVGLASSGGVRGGDLALAGVANHAAPFESLLLGRRATLDACAPEYAIDDRAAGVVERGEREDPGPGGIGGADFVFRWDRVLDVRHVRFDGWAFDASTASQLYLSDGYVVHNCRCLFVAAGTMRDALQPDSRTGDLRSSGFLDLRDFDPEEPRNPQGEWTTEGITAYHGSGHDFTKFDLAHMGQGEGSQAYGYGLYLAEEPAVAEDYKTEGGGPGGGNVYTVRIHAKPDEFVDWDKPLSEQPKLVRDMVGPKGRADMKGEMLMRGFLGMGRNSSARMAAAGIKGVRYLDRESRERQTMAGQLRAARAEYESLRRQDMAASMTPSYAVVGPFGGGLGQLPSFGRGGGSDVRGRMDALDRQIRRMTETLSHPPTHNYVVFDPSIIEVTHKNGVKLSPFAAHDALVAMLADYDPDEPRDDSGKWTFGQPRVARQSAAQRPPLVGGSGGEGETHQGLPVRETRVDPKRIAAASAQLKRWKVKELTSVLHKSFGKGGEYFAREWAIAEPDGSYSSVRMRSDGKVNVGQPSMVGFHPDPKQETARLYDGDGGGPA